MLKILTKYDAKAFCPIGHRDYRGSDEGMERWRASIRGKEGRSALSLEYSAPEAASF